MAKPAGCDYTGSKACAVMCGCACWPHARFLTLSNWNTGRCCRTWCFTVDTSSLRTQYLVVERTKPCEQRKTNTSKQCGGWLRTGPSWHVDVNQGRCKRVPSHLSVRAGRRTQCVHAAVCVTTVQIKARSDWQCSRRGWANKQPPSNQPVRRPRSSCLWCRHAAWSTPETG